MANQSNTVAAPQPIAKGTIKLIPCFGSIGSVVTNFDTKEVIPGSFRHTQTVNGEEYTWKCAQVSLTGVVKLVRGEFNNNGVMQGFWRMEGLVNDVAVVTNTKNTLAALEEMAF